MSERMSLYLSPGEPGKRGFEDLDCYKLALEVMAKIHGFPKPCLLTKSLICMLKYAVLLKGLLEILAKHMVDTIIWIVYGFIR